MKIEVFLFSLINNLAFKNDFLDFLFIFSAKYLGYFMTAFVVYQIFKKRRLIFALIAGFLARYGIVEIVRMVFFRNRPFTERIASVLVEHQETASFPSGHAAFFFALSMVVFHENRKTGLIFFFLSFLISFSRVASGIHWVSDILVGALVGIFVGWLTTKTLFYQKLS
jgi:undecaprenyl-diphosphatase